MKRARTIIVKCGIVVTVLIVACVIAELVLRMTGYQMVNTPYSWFQNIGLYEIDGELIYRTRPGYTDPYNGEYTNVLGMKVHDSSDQLLHKAKRTLVVLGDSFVWGETSQNDTYPQQLQNILDNMNTEVKVYNAGISGYGTDQEYIYFARYVLPNIHPDIVVWNINTNDISDNIYTPLFDIQGEKLVQIPLWTNGVYITARFSTLLPRFIKHHSRLVNLVLRVLERVRLHRIANQNYHQWSLDKIGLEIHQMQVLAKKNHFTLYIASDPMQCIIEKLACDAGETDETNSINNLVDNKIDLIDQTQYLIPSTPSGELFLNESDKFPDGWWHPDAQGNFLMAKSVVDKLLQYQKSVFNQHQ